jgi:flagellar biosynthetic protein FliQ
LSLGDITAILRAGIFHVLLLAAPLLLSALIVGLVVAILQATTSIQEQTLTFVPKVLAIMLMLAFLGGLGFSILADYTTELFRQIPNMAR